MRTNENGVSVPANSNLFGVKIDRKKSTMLGHDVVGQSRFSITKTTVGFLQRNDVRTDLVYDRKNPLRPTQPVRADGLADVIAGNPDHLATLATSSTSAKPKR